MRDDWLRFPICGGGHVSIRTETITLISTARDNHREVFSSCKCVVTQAHKIDHYLTHDYDEVCKKVVGEDWPGQ